MEDNFPDDEIEIELAPIAVQLAYVKQVILQNLRQQSFYLLKRKKGLAYVCCLDDVLELINFFNFHLVDWDNTTTGNACFANFNSFLGTNKRLLKRTQIYLNEIWQMSHHLQWL